ncbi:MAG: hypothetical protein PUC05_03205 [Firmicutes bacterium]|nr:hypothetical protein [Bacillota bacterium]
MKKVICVLALAVLLFPAINALGEADRENSAYKTIEYSVYK